MEYDMAVLNRTRSLSDSLKHHPGEWVAIRGEKVVGSAPTLERLRELTEDKQIDGVFQVPFEKPGGGVFL